MESSPGNSPGEPCTGHPMRKSSPRPRAPRKRNFNQGCQLEQEHKLSASRTQYKVVQVGRCTKAIGWGDNWGVKSSPQLDWREVCLFPFTKGPSTHCAKWGPHLLWEMFGCRRSMFNEQRPRLLSVLWVNWFLLPFCKQKQSAFCCSVIYCLFVFLHLCIYRSKWIKGLVLRTGAAFIHSGGTQGMFHAYLSVGVNYKSLSISAACSPAGV